jgi:branched-chain amino acid aminotransferase
MIILSPANHIIRRSSDHRHFSRAANGGIGLQKLQVTMPHILSTSLNAGFQQVIWTDDATHTGRGRGDDVF